MLGFLFLLAFVVFARVEIAPGLGTPINPKKAIWGPNLIPGKSSVRVFDEYRRLGISIYSLAIDWSRAAPTKPADPTNPDDPAYRWPRSVVRGVAKARAAGMRVNIALSKAPAWANGGHPKNWAPLDANDYADFATAAARKFPDVHMWMVWGEPTRQKNFMPYEKSNNTLSTELTPAQAAGPQRYAQILDAAYGALKSDAVPDGRSNIITGGNSFTAGDIRAPQWVRYMRLPNGMPPRLDLYGHNVFSTRKPDLGNPPSARNAMDFSDVARLERVVTKNLGHPYGKKMVPLFISEWCVPTSAKDEEFNYWVDKPDQADWIRSAFDIVNNSNYIYALGWIHLIDMPRKGEHDATACGLLNDDGSEKPGAQAFRKG